MLTEIRHQLSQPQALTSKELSRSLAKELVSYYFTDDKDEPFILTDGQADIFNLIFLRLHPRNEVIAPTQYGKSSTVAMALILRSQTFAEDWGIITGDVPKSMIIMEKVIQHCFDHPDLYAQLELDPTENLDRLRKNRTRQHLSWKHGGSVRIFTADARNRQRVKQALSGFGIPNLIEDEASLLENDVQAMILRMLGGHQDNFLLKIGNPYQPSPNHFYKTWYDSLYNRLFIDYHQARAEGRYTDEFIEEMRNQPFFDILYECKFPPEDAVLSGGWRKIITEKEIERAFVPTETHIIQAATGKARLGVDIGRGINKSVFCLRYDNIAEIIERNTDKDLMAQVGKIINFMKHYNISSSNIFIDDVGVGGGVTDRMVELGYGVVGIKEGGKAEDNTRFANMRAEMYWQGAKWIKDGGKLIKHDGFRQLSLINVKEDSSSKLRVEPKSELVKRGVDSPDDADAFSLTFGRTTEYDGDFAIL